MSVSLRETPLSDRILVFTMGGDEVSTSFGANCVAVRGSRGTLLVDPLVAPAHARRVEEALGRAGFPPVVEVVVTHHHTDHALGAGLFAARGVRVHAHRRCAEAMAALHPALVADRREVPSLAALFADAEPYAPGALFEEMEAIDLGDLAAEVRHLGPAHTPGDAVVLFPSEGLAVAGDLLLHGYHANYEDADRQGVRRSLAELSALAVRFVPGHGPPGGRELLAEQARYHDEAERIARRGPTAEEAAAELVARFPGHLLAAAAAEGVRFWRGRGRTPRQEGGYR